MMVTNVDDVASGVRRSRERDDLLEYIPRCASCGDGHDFEALELVKSSGGIEMVNHGDSEELGNQTGLVVYN